MMLTIWNSINVDVILGWLCQKGVSCVIFGYLTCLFGICFGCRRMGLNGLDLERMVV